MGYNNNSKLQAQNETKVQFKIKPKQKRDVPMNRQLPQQPIKPLQNNINNNYSNANPYNIKSKNQMLNNNRYNKPQSFNHSYNNNNTIPYQNNKI